MAEPPRRHHIDRRAHQLISLAEREPEDQLLNTKQLAHFLGVSVQWCEIGRCKGYGPPFIRISPKRIRYRWGDILAWLKERTHFATSEYDEQSLGEAHS